MSDDIIINGEVVSRSEMFSTPERCLALVKHNPIYLQDMPENMKTYMVCLEAIKNSKTRNILPYVPELLRSTELYTEYAKKYKYALHEIPEEIQTYEMCLYCVKNYGESLEIVPEKYKTPELCLEAIENTFGEALMYTPEKYKTFGLCLRAISRSKSVQDWAEFISLSVPKKHQTLEFYAALIETQMWEK